MKRTVLMIIVMVAVVLPISGQGFYLSGYAEATADPTYPEPRIEYQVSATVLDTFRLGFGDVVQFDNQGPRWTVESIDALITTSLARGPVEAGLRFTVPVIPDGPNNVEMFLRLDWSIGKEEKR